MSYIILFLKHDVAKVQQRAKISFFHQRSTYPQSIVWAKYLLKHDSDFPDRASSGPHERVHEIVSPVRVGVPLEWDLGPRDYHGLAQILQEEAQRRGQIRERICPRQDDESREPLIGQRY